MADPIALKRPPTGQRYDPQALDAKGATLGTPLVATDDGSGGKRAGYGSTAIGTGAALTADTDGTLAANSDDRVATQKAVRTFVASQINGLSWKHRVRVATTANGTLATAFASGQTVDGVTLATGDRILLKNQTAGAENGLYNVAASGAPTRTTDADAGAELVNAAVFVAEGSSNADTQWVCTNNETPTLGSTALTFAQIGAGTSYTADGTTLQLSGTTFSVKSGGIGPSELASTAVTPGSYTNTNLTVDADGRITAASNGTDTGGASGTGSSVSITSNLHCYYKAAAATYGSDRVVTAINDDPSSSGGFQLTQATAALQPFYVAKDPVANNQPALSFSGQEYMATANLPVNATDNFTFFCVCRVNFTANFAVLFMNGVGASNGMGLAIQYSGDAPKVTPLYQNIAFLQTTRSYDLHAPTVVCFERVSGTTTVYVNAVATSATFATGVSAPGSQFIIGASLNGSNAYYRGLLYEILGYAAALSSGDRNTVTSELMTAYGLA